MKPNLRSSFQAWRQERRLERQFRTLERTIPLLRQPMGALRGKGYARFIRLPLAVLFILGGIFSFLPFLGAWMLPLGLLLLAIDLPFIRQPVTALTIRGRRFLQRRWRRYRPY